MPAPVGAKLPAKVLQAIAFQCGLAQAGTRPVLAERIQTAAREFQPLTPDARILSIDMGLRNFAFSLLSPPKPPPLTQHPSTNKPTPLAHLHAWKRIDLLRLSAAADSQASDDFTPSTMAARAVALVQSRFLPLAPTHVLIERQRFRSGGASGVLEWTLRVNTLEAMLYAAFTTLRAVGAWDGQLVAVPPSRATRFMVGEGEVGVGGVLLGLEAEGEGVGAKMKQADSKKLKIDLLGRCLEGGRVIELEGAQVKKAVDDFLEGRAKTATGRSRVKPTETSVKKKKGETVVKSEAGAILTKLDDLSDSLLQGVAWLEWQRNIGRLHETVPWVLGDPE
ncbi:mitochondrial resolvase Ydc2 [Lasiosphaeris hirsuta]|uniref:Mitochondrial resolvase Ydc2 n=1 Tax=Lasiosphaeris hirsuta TaxID=260670 RepID=A0AA40DIW4_9PEZI|nr:mitochondrial resolvase Ydc2 [Lasiosphaeris hirsuta]